MFRSIVHLFIDVIHYPLSKIIDNIYVINATIISDHDECATNVHLCDQMCHNSYSSYYCTCDLGYLVDTDGRTCNGIIVSLFIVLSLILLYLVGIL